MMPPIARMLTELTDSPLKIQWSAAGTLAGLSADKHYGSDRERAMAIAAALNEDILEVDAIEQVKSSSSTSGSGRTSSRTGASRSSIARWRACATPR